MTTLWKNGIEISSTMEEQTSAWVYRKDWLIIIIFLIQKNTAGQDIETT